MRWRVLVPIKPAEVAKTRLRGATAAESGHARLVRALQRDTLAAVLAAAAEDPLIAGVYVIGAPSSFGELPAGVAVLPDRGQGLNDALTRASSAVRAVHPDEGHAALVADLPALRPRELLDVLRAAATTPRGFVPDAAGRGTTMLTAWPDQQLAPAFGDGSARRHRASAATELPAGPGARTDVDTAEDLRRCLALGVGEHTASMVGHLV